MARLQCAALAVTYKRLVLAGCGMCAVPFGDLHKDKLRLRDLQKIQRLIKERIPTGSAAHPFPSAPEHPMYAFRLVASNSRARGIWL